MWPKRDQPDEKTCPTCGTPQTAPEAAQETTQEQPRLPVAIYGTKEERTARFGPPIDPKNQPPRLVSLGEQQRRFSGAAGQPDRLVTIEAFMDQAANVYYRWPGETCAPHRANITTGKQDAVERFPIAPAPRRGIGVGRRPDPNAKKTDTVQRLDPDPEIMRLARNLAALERGPDH